MLSSLRMRLPYAFRLPRALRFARTRRGLACACLLGASLFGLWFLWHAATRGEKSSRVAANAHRERDIDAGLQSAASQVLGEREGTVVVLDAQTGRLRAVAGERFAYAETLAPGSTVKPFTLLAALRARLVEMDARTLCPGTYRRDDFEINCSHPRFKPPFNPAQALAHSCNFYFSKLGERLDAPAFNTTLASFGFGTRTGANHGERVSKESAGRLPRTRWRASQALGEGQDLLVTPLQLVTAYAALANGGRLFRPQQHAANDNPDAFTTAGGNDSPTRDDATSNHAATSGGDATSSDAAASDDDDATPRLRRRIRIPVPHRRIILEGMRGAVTYGTAARAGLGSLPVNVYGKTGTSTSPDARGNDGWFVGFVSDRDAASADAAGAFDASPASVRLVVLIFFKNATGAECAAAARPIFETYARTRETKHATPEAMHAARDTTDDGLESSHDDATNVSPHDSTDASPHDSSPSAATRARVRVHVQGATLTLPLEEYLFGVLAAEASVENEPEALKAQAVISRTFALKNMRRHARDGFDLCASTHCQRFVSVADEGARPVFYDAARRAIAATRGEILRDAAGRVAEAYFSASCGGATADIGTLWGQPAPSHLRGVGDPFCEGAAYRNWTDAIDARRLAEALGADPRSDTGGRLDRISVVRRDMTGRVEMLAVEGARRRVLRGWDFKIIVGRSLGWSVIKSSRFTVTRAGAKFIFRGSGFGHGLGLCQLGAHTQARRGASYRQILRRYLPGTNVGHGDRAALSRNTNDAPAPTLPTRVEHSIQTQTNTARRRDVRSTRGDSISLSGDSISFPDDSISFSDDSINHSDASAAMRPASFHVVTPSGFQDARLEPSRAFVQPSRAFVQGAGRARRAMLSGEAVRVNYPVSVARRDVEQAIRTLEAARRDVRGRLSAASLNADVAPGVEVFMHESAGAFAGATGEPHWVAAITRGRRIEMQPPAVLRRRGVFEMTLRHEYAHAAVEALGRGRAPRWLTEGLAVHVAGEGRLLARGAGRNVSREELERRLARPSTAEEMRALYAAAHAEVSRMIRSEGESSVWRRIARA